MIHLRIDRESLKSHNYKYQLLRASGEPIDINPTQLGKKIASITQKSAKNIPGITHKRHDQ